MRISNSSSKGPRPISARPKSAPGDPPVAVRIYRPDQRLEPYVTFFYFVEAGAPLQDFLYPEWGNVRLVLDGEWTVQIPGFEKSDSHGAVLFGPTDHCGLIETTGGKSLGFGLTPLGWQRLIGGDASILVNQSARLEHQLGCDGQQLWSDLKRDATHSEMIVRLTTLLLAQLTTRPLVGTVARDVDRALRSRPTEVTQFAALAGLPPRTLQRVCLRTFGFAPKRLMRLQRFLDTLGQVRSAVGAPLGDAIGEDYCDQPHFYRDFRDFMTMSPRTYFSAPRPLMAAAADAQVAAGVTLSFRLPSPPS